MIWIIEALLFLFLTKPVFATSVCGGAVTSFYSTCDDWQTYDPFCSPYGCGYAWVWHCSQGSGMSSDGCSFYGTTCMGYETMGAVCNYMDRCEAAGSCEGGGSGNACPSQSGCWTCDTEVCGGTATCTQECGSTTQSCSCPSTCTGITYNYSETVACKECGPYYGSWSSCDASHKRYRNVDYDCPAPGGHTDVEDQNCVGTIQGTLFDASDMTSCPGDIGTNAAYASLRYGNQGFGLSGTWGLINPPASTDANGNYLESVYASTLPATYSYNYDDLYTARRAVAVKLECQSSVANVTGHGQVVTKDTGFWRIYGGWWQTVGGSVYAGTGMRSAIPTILTPAADQVLILADATGKSGMLSYGMPWTGTQLGANPNAKVSTKLWRIESLYEGQRYDYDFYKIRMDIFPSTDWDGGSIEYTGDEVGYQIFKYMGDVVLNSNIATGTEKVILLIDGNVTISGNVITPPGAFLAVIASGDITFGSGVTNAQGWFVGENINVPCADTSPADGTCDKTDVQFQGEGSFVGWSGIGLIRDMGIANNLDPSELFTYRTDFMLNAPAPMKKYTKRFNPFIP